MTDMPEKIWIESEADEVKEGYGSWDSRNVYNYDVEYTRSDIAWNEALEAAAKAAEVTARAEEEVNNPRDAELFYYAAKHIRAMKREPK